MITPLGAYFNTLRRPARTVYVLDVSGSMAGQRIAGLKAALDALTGAVPSQINQFDQLHEREQITLLPFATTSGIPATFGVPADGPQPVLDQVRTYAAGLRTGGNTVPVFVILLGEANAAEMNRLATLTGGLTFDARDQSLTAVFKDIRGYQ